MNKEEFKGLIKFTAPYIVTVIGVLVLTIVVIEFLSMIDYMILAPILILILAVGAFLALDMTMLAGDIYRLKLYLKNQLEDEIE